MESLLKPQIICYNETSVNYSLHDSKWLPCSAKFVTVGGKSNGAGVAEIYTLSSEGKIEKSHEFSSGEHFRCCTFEGANLRARHLATGDFGGRLQVWDVEDTTWPVYKVKVKEKSIINAVDGIVGYGAPEIATGSSDGAVKVWDVRQKDEPVAKFIPNTECGRDCWSVGFGDDYGDNHRVIAAGYDNGDVKMFDLRNMKTVWSKNVKNGIVGLQFDRKEIAMNKLVLTTLEAKIFVIDCRTFHPKKGFSHLVEKSHAQTTVWTVKHLPQNRDLFLTTGGSGGLNLWKYDYPSKRIMQDSDGLEYGVMGQLNLLQNCTLSDQPVTSFDWCKEKLGLGVCTAFDQTIRVVIVTKLNLY